jgi:hypothetical protein
MDLLRPLPRIPRPYANLASIVLSRKWDPSARIPRPCARVPFHRALLTDSRRRGVGYHFVVRRSQCSSLNENQANLY